MFIVFIMMHFEMIRWKIKVIYHLKIFIEQSNNKVNAIFGANATILGFTTLLTDKLVSTVLTKDGKTTNNIVY